MAALEIEMKGEIGEPMLMIFHVIAVEEERPILRPGYEKVPVIPQLSCISPYFEHFR